MIDAFPLQWPEGWPRTPRHEKAVGPNKMPSGRIRSLLMDELRKMGAKDIVLSSNVAVRRDGLPYANQPQPTDTGVVLYFKRKGKEISMPCDRWLSLDANLRAIGMTVEAIRGIERWGSEQMVDRAFTGYTALSANAIVTPFTAKPWHEVLEVAPTASPETVRAAYRSLLLRHHPDQGGDEARFHNVQRAWTEYQSGNHSA